MLSALLTSALLTSAPLAAAAPATASRVADRKVPVAVLAGKAISCIPIPGIRNTVVRDDRTIDFIMRGGKRVFRNTLPRSCPSLGFERRFSYTTSQTQLCSVDLITVLPVSSPVQGVTCGLGTFQPVALGR